MLVRSPVGVPLLAIALALVGCTASPRTCRGEPEARITAFVAGMRAAIEHTSVTVEDVDLPVVAARGAPDYDGLLIELDHRGLGLLGDRVEHWRSTSLLFDQVLREEMIAEAQGRVAEPGLLAVIAADVPARDVADLLGLAERAGFVRVGFVATPAAGPIVPPSPEPGLPAIIRERAGDPAREAVVVQELLAAEVVRCPQLGEPVPQSMAATPRHRALVILETTQQALIACSCAADVDRILALAHFLTAPERITMVSPALSLGPNAEVVLARADTPWSELAPAVFTPERAGIRLRIQ
jgi:hypothetical protein